MALSLMLTIAFLFGVTNKLADLMNEHGVFWFKGGNVLFGIIWGLFGSILMLTEPILTPVYLSVVLYWFLSIKLDYLNHALAGTMMVLAAVISASQHAIDVFGTIAMLIAYSLVGLIQRRSLGRHPQLDAFWRLRLRIYVIPLIYSWYTGSALPFLVTLSGMIGVEIVTNYYRHVRKVA